MTDFPQKAAAAPILPRKHLLAAGLCSAAMVVALTLLPTPDATAIKTVRLEAPVIGTAAPALETIAETVATIEDNAAVEKAMVEAEAIEIRDEALALDEQQQNWKSEKVRSGDTLSHIFKRAGLDARQLHDVLQAKGDLAVLKKIHPGQQLRFNVRDDSLVAVEYVMSRTDSLFISKVDDHYQADLVTQELVPFTSYAEGTISSSLFVAGRKAGLSTALTMELANIFGWDVDFALDIRAGDSFRVIYNQLYLDGDKVEDGDILAAQFTNQGKTFTAIRYETSDRGADYFTPSGDSMRKAFLRSPVDFARISSHFNLARKHPVLHTIRAHKGTDYAAVRGTPIKATGDGKVAFAGWKGGYGRVVILQHGQGIQTLYGHMNGFGRNIRAGTRVNQGQVIGYVGSTGLATGPHLHYEFYVNGSVRNPVTVKLPQANPIASADKSAFSALAARMQGQLSTYAATMQSEKVARADINE